MLKEQFEWDEQNTKKSIEYLESIYKGCTSFFDDLDSQFEKLKSLIPPQTYTKQAQLKAWLLADTQRQLALMGSTFLRGHITDSYGNARRAVELVATMGRISKDEAAATQASAAPPQTAASPPMPKPAQAKPAAKPIVASPDLTSLWFGCDSDAGLTAYKKEAKIINLWNDSLSTVATPKTKYGLLCTKVHTGAFSIIESIPRDGSGNLILNQFKPHQLSPQGTELLVNFLFLTDTFIQILEGIAEIYGIQNDAAWTVSINGWRAKRDMIRTAFQPVLKQEGVI